MADFEFKSLRSNAQSSVLEWTDIGGDRQTSHASEWWNGEGIDFSFYDAKGRVEKSMSLHMDDMHAMFVQALAFGMLDLDELKTQADLLKQTMR